MRSGIVVQHKLPSERMRDLPIKENPGSVIRATIANFLHLEESQLTDDFPWYEEAGEEDAGWLLAKVQERFRVALFDTYIAGEQLAAISTIGGLIEFVERRLEKSNR